MNFLNFSHFIDEIPPSPQTYPYTSLKQGVIQMFNLKFSWQGTWSSTTQYQPFDAVVYGGSMYICVAVSTGNEPDTDAGAHWQAVSLRVDEHGPEVRTLTTQPISGTVAVSNFPSTYAVTGPLTDTQLRASAIAVDASGTTVPVSVQNSSIAVTGTFWPTTQPVSGTVTANAGSGIFTVDGSGVTQPISGTVAVNNFPATQAVSWTGQSVSVSNFPSTYAVTGTFWQSTQPVSIAATVAVDASGHTVPVSGTFWQTTQPVSGTVTANAGTGTFSVDASGHTVPVSGTFWQTTQPVSIAATVNVQQTPATSGGMGLPYSASVTGTKAQVKGSAGQIYGWTIVNNGSALCYVQVFNKTSGNVTVGTTTPDFVIPIPAPASGTNGAGVAQTLDLGIAMNTGITIACTTTRTGSTSATCDVLFYYA